MSPSSVDTQAYDEDTLFRRCYKEGYNIYDEKYVAWLRNHPESVRPNLAPFASRHDDSLVSQTYFSNCTIIVGVYGKGGEGGEKEIRCIMPPFRVHCRDAGNTNQTAALGIAL